ASSQHPGESEEQVPYLRHVSQIGRRTAEMHLAFASTSALPDFAPEPIQVADVQRWTEELTSRTERIFHALKEHRDKMSEPDRPLIDQTLAHRAALHGRLTALCPTKILGMNIRQHGDFNLGR